MSTFPLRLDVQDEALASVLKLLDRTPGVTGVKLDLPSKALPGTNGVVRSAGRPPADAPKSGMTGAQVIVSMLMTGPQEISALRTALMEHGSKSRNTIHGVLHTLRKDGIVEPTGRHGWHRLTSSAVSKLKSQHNGVVIDAEPAAPPKLPKPDPEPEKRPVGGQSRGVREAILERYKKAPSISRLELVKGISQAIGVTESAVDGALGRLRRTDGWLKISQPGIYELTAKGKSHLAKG